VVACLVTSTLAVTSASSVLAKYHVHTPKILDCYISNRVVQSYLKSKYQGSFESEIF